MRARYVVDTSKALEVILWLSSECPGIDIYHIVKCAFYADKYHLNKFGRPITGDNYIADTYGPLGKTIYNLIRGEPFEILALGGNGQLPFSVGEQWQITPSRGANQRRLSESDREALRHALKEYAGRSFDELYVESHDDPAYIAANGGSMRYEDFIPEDDPQRQDKIEYIQEVASTAVL